MFSRPSPLRRPLALALALLLSGLPALAAAEPPVPPARPATPIADSAARAALVQRYGRGRGDSDALKWTGFGLLAGGASLIAIGAVLDDSDCFETDISRGDCRNARRGRVPRRRHHGRRRRRPAGDGQPRSAAAWSRPGPRARSRPLHRFGVDGGRMVLQERIVF